MSKLYTKKSHKKGAGGGKKVNFQLRKLSFLLRTGGLTSVTFVKENDTILVQKVGRAFSHHKNGRPRGANEVMSDLNVIKHDLRCKSIIL